MCSVECTRPIRTCSVECTRPILTSSAEYTRLIFTCSPECTRTILTCSIQIHWQMKSQPLIHTEFDDQGARSTQVSFLFECELI